MRGSEGVVVEVDNCCVNRKNTYSAVRHLKKDRTYEDQPEIASTRLLVLEPVLGLAATQTLNKTKRDLMNGYLRIQMSLQVSKKLPRLSDIIKKKKGLTSITPTKKKVCTQAVAGEWSRVPALTVEDVTHSVHPT